ALGLEFVQHVAGLVSELAELLADLVPGFVFVHGVTSASAYRECAPTGQSRNTPGVKPDPTQRRRPTTCQIATRDARVATRSTNPGSQTTNRPYSRHRQQRRSAQCPRSVTGTAPRARDGRVVGLEQHVEHHGRTRRLDWVDPSLREWDCTVVWSDPADPEA